MEAWYHRFHTLYKITKKHPYFYYDILGISIQLKWQYLQRTVPIVGTMVGLIEESLRENFLPVIVLGEEVNVNLQKIIGRSVKYGDLGIPEPQQ